MSDDKNKKNQTRHAVNETEDGMPVLRLEPDKRLCPAFDPVSIAEFRVGSPDEMGYRVVDNFCEEHIE